MSGGDVWFFDRLAPLYDPFVPSADPDDLADALSRADRDIERVLDVGGGTGRAVRVLDAPERIVLDASAGMLSRVPDDVDPIRGSGTDIPVCDESVDAVLVVDALHHLPEQRTVVEEAARVLRPGGVLVVREFDRSTVRGRALAIGERALRMRSTFLTTEEIGAAMSDAGFEPVAIRDGFRCTVVGRKPGVP